MASNQDKVAPSFGTRNRNSNYDTTDRISDVVPYGRLWYSEPNAISCAKFYSRSHDGVIRVYDELGNVIKTHEHARDFEEW